MTTGATASALVAACKAGGLRAVRLLLDQGAPVTDEAWRAAAERADPALMFVLETADFTREQPAWLAAALMREETLAELPRIVDALHGADFAAQRKAARRLLDAGADDSLSLEPAVRRRALAVSLSHSPEEAAVVEEALAAGLDEPMARGAGLTASRAVRLAASTLATAVSCGPAVDWERIDRLRGHASAAVREGAVAALAAAWPDHVEAVAIAGRLLDALADASEDVGRVAGERLAAGMREGTISTDAVRARLPPGAAGRGGPVGELARVTDGLVDARKRYGCEACGPLGAEAEWGEYIGRADVPEPPEVKHLRRVVNRGGSADVYRCSRCGTYFDRTTYEQTFLAGNSTWDSHTLTRCVGPAPDLDVYEAARTGDAARLRAALIEHADDAVRVQSLNALERLVREGYDVTALEPALGELARVDRPSAVREVAASVVALHALQAVNAGRVDEVAAFVEKGDPVLRAAALSALSQSRERSPAAVQECVRRIRPTLWKLATEGEDVRYAATHLLGRVGLDAEVVAQADRNLHSGDPRLREVATDVLAAAAEARLDVSASLPRLAALLRDPDTGGDAANALGAAHLRGADVAPFVEGMAAFVRAQPRTSRALELTHVLHALQERGVDITPAFEPLALDGRDWPMSVLGHAVERGRDLEAAVPELQRRADTDESYLGRMAAEILAAHFARRQDWSRLTPLLRHPSPERADAARTAVERAAVQERVPLEALYLLGRLQAGDAPADPKRTTWTKERDNVEVREREVVRWTEDGRGGIGTSCTLKEFLAGKDQVSVFQTFGARVLNEVVAAAHRIARQRNG